MNIKNQKAAAIFHNLAAEYFNKEVSFDSGIVTVTAVDISTDHREVIVWVGLQNISPQDFAKKSKPIESQLRYFVSRKSRLKYTPIIKLKIDDSIAAAQRVSQLLE